MSSAPGFRLDPEPDGIPEGNVAAVAVFLYPSLAGCGTLLTVRRPDLSRHAGQVAFPGGAREPGDRDLLQTALREAAEEVGVRAAPETVLGWLPYHYVEASRFHVAPLVLWLDERPTVRLNAAEVAAVLFPDLLPLWATLTWEDLGGRRSPAFQWEGHRVWGATARILLTLRDRYAPARGARREEAL